MEKILEQWLLNNMAQELFIFFSSMLPGGLYFTIPIAINTFQYPIWKAILLSVTGNTLTCVPIYLICKYLSEFLSRYSEFCKRYFVRLFAKTRKRHSKRFEVLGAFALVTLSAIPIPGAGARTGIIAAFVFGISFLKGIIFILIGIVLKGIAIALATLGIIETFHFFN